MNCSVDGCEIQVLCMGMCSNHYSRNLRAKNLERYRQRDREHYHRNIEKERDAMRRRYREGDRQPKAIAYYHKNKDEINVKRKANRTPDTIDGWARAVRHKAIVNTSIRKFKGKGYAKPLSFDEARAKVKSATDAGDVDFFNPFNRPSPDRIDNNRGYSAENVQVVPAWLNFAYHSWDKKLVEDAILKWARKRLVRELE